MNPCIVPLVPWVSTEARLVHTPTAHAAAAEEWWCCV